MISVSPAQIIATALIRDTRLTAPADGGDWPVYISSLPDGPSIPDNAVCVYDTTGLAQARTMSGTSYSRLGVMVKVRSATYADGWAVAAEIYQALIALKASVVTVKDSSFTVQLIVLDGPPLALGPGPSSPRREFFSINGTASIR